ncbi:hypothetical protein MBANPS3_005243 [Mucor bainieri]
MADSYLLDNYNTELFDMITLIEKSEYTVKEDFERYLVSLMEKWRQIKVKSIKDGQKADVAHSIIDSNYKIMKTETYSHYWIQKNNRVAALQMNESFTNSLRKTSAETAKPIVKKRKLRASTQAAMPSNADKDASSSAAEIAAKTTHASPGAAGNVLDSAVISIDDLKSINESYDQSLFDEDPFNFNDDVAKSRVTIISNKKVVDFHTPSTCRVSPNKPAIRKEDYVRLQDIFDIVISTNRGKVSSGNLTQYFDSHHALMTKNTSIQTIQHAMDLLESTVFKPTLYDERCVWSFPEDSPFLKMMKRCLSDFLIDTERVPPVSCQHERTFMAEAVVPWFKAFEVMMGMSFKWFENHDANSKATWLPLSDYRLKDCKTKLYDGLGLSPDHKNAIFIESSGGSHKVDHMVEDSIKNMKNCTDFLKHLSCCYKQANIDTFKSIKIPCINIIDDKMTLSVCYVNSKTKWAFVEVHNTIIPITAPQRLHLVKVFDLFALLKTIVDNNTKALHELELENLGLSKTNYTTVDQFFT